jgi:23S rRNA pseudouridine1911/1915/1917 synthase
MPGMPWREVPVPPGAGGMRLDRFLSRRFADKSRSFFARGIRHGLVCDAEDRPLDASHRVRDGDLLRVSIPGIAPTTPPPPFPPILHDDGRIVAVDKPAGLLSHPAGTAFQWAVVSLAKDRWPSDRIDLMHRLDRDTSGVLVLTRDLAANRHLKEAVKRGQVTKVYDAIVRGVVPWDDAVLDGPIGPDNGPIRIRMAVRADGQSARTAVRVLERGADLTRVACVLHTGRTHQIRVHLAHAGFPVVGDRLYGVPPDVFLNVLARGVDRAAIEAAGAPRHALHARRVELPHPDGHQLTVEAQTPADLERWWRDPSVLPHDYSRSTVQYSRQGEPAGR